jgi:DNA-binding CsgD family transcriptional regulator
VGTILFGIAAPAWGLINEPLDREAPHGYPRSVTIGVCLMALAILTYLFRRKAFEVVRREPAWVLLPTGAVIGALWADGSLPTEYYPASLTPLLAVAMVVGLRWALVVAATLAAGHLVGVVVVNGHSFGQMWTAGDLDDFIEQLGAYFVLAVLVALPVEALGGYVLRVSQLLSSDGVTGASGDGRSGALPEQHRSTAALSVRETEVTELVADGLSNDRIAQQLYLSPRTVQTHVANAMRKTETSSRTELAVVAVREALVARRGG